MGERGMTTNLRWGVLGCADIATRAMIPALQEARNAKVTVIASRSLERASSAAERFGIGRSVGSYEALVESPDVDAVYVPLPTSLHAEWTIAAARAGKHVLCEKPLATAVEDVDRVIAAAAEHDVVVMEALMYRLHPQTHRVEDLVRSGHLGSIQLVTASFTYGLSDERDIRLTRALGGGVLFDVGTYCVSTARQSAGAEPYLVQGFARFGPGSDVDEVFTGLLRFPTECVATFGCALRAQRDQWYRITGSEATLVVPVPFAPGIDDRELIVMRGVMRGKESREHITVPGVDQYRLLVEHFADVVLAGVRPQIGLRETRANVAVLEALMASAVGVEPRPVRSDPP
jgi:D-xylose 1-dehydrogenase (NADP+, D-xylono-1,5-lactone-forming)